MLDFVFLAMFAIVPLLAASIAFARTGRHYEVHKRLQMTLAVVLLVAVTAFEVDMRFITGNWEQLAEVSPFFHSGLVHAALYVHLCFAIPTPVLWAVVLFRALRGFPRPAGPSPHSQAHVFWARLAVAWMVLTAVTGWTFYWLAFVA
jgi:uncharacterized membrane protein YozB (DUF420 family)